MAQSEGFLESVDTEPLRVIDSEAIVDVQLSDATRMPYPEKSYLEELLDTPIPLQNRIDHLIPYIDPTADLLTAYGIANKIGQGVTDDWVITTARRIGIQPTEGIGRDGSPITLYPPLSAELLEEEWIWYVAYQELDPMVSTYRIAEFVGRGHLWVDSRAHELNIYPEHIELDRKRKVWAYPKTLIPMLRHILLIILPEEDWLTFGEIKEMTGKSKYWIESRLNESGYTPEDRWSAVDGRISKHYPHSVLETLKTYIENQPKAAGDWLTTKAISELVGKDYEWVKARVDARYSGQSELRLGNDHKSHPHYPPQVIEALKNEAEATNAYPMAGDYLAINALARAVGHGAPWVTRRLPFLDVDARIMLDKAMRPFPHYPPQTVEALNALPPDILARKGVTD